MQVGSGVRCVSPGSPDLPGYDEDDDGEVLAADNLILPPSHLVNERALWFEQQQVGQVVFTPSSKKLLTDMLDEVYVQLQPKAPDWEARQTVIQFITKFVNHKIPGSSISAFGSFVMELFTSSSDLDLSLNLSDGKCDRSRADQVHYLRKVAKALYGLQNGQRQSVRGIETVYRAAVPVVKFVECKTGIECDISVENNDGVLKSQVLRMFSTMDSRFRQLCYLVKAWAKKHNVNSSKNGTLNSLSICLLVAFHLQTRAIPILPPFSVFMTGLHLPAIGSCLETVASRVKEYKDRGFGKDNTESVPELFGSFFLKLIAVESLWGQGLCSSTYEGKWISKIWPKNHIGCISVEDFADRTQNVARSVSRKEFELIYQVLQSTVSNLKDPVLDVLEAKDLKAYLFGSIRHRRRGLEHTDVTAYNMGIWQGGNGWSTPLDRRPQFRKGLYEQTSETPQYQDQTWNHSVAPPVLFTPYHSHAGRGPGHRAFTYRKVGGPNGIAKVDPTFDANGHGEDREIHHRQPYDRSRMHYPRLETRSNPAFDDSRQVSQHPGSGYRDFSSGYGGYSHRKNVFIPEQGSNHSGGGYVLKEVDFPSIAGEHGPHYSLGYVAVEPPAVSRDYGGSEPSEEISIGFIAVEPTPVQRMTYAAVGSRPRNDHLVSSPAIAAGGQQSQVQGRRPGRRGWPAQTPNSDSNAHQCNSNGYQVPIRRNVNWQERLSPNRLALMG